MNRDEIGVEVRRILIDQLGCMPEQIESDSVDLFDGLKLSLADFASTIHKLEAGFGIAIPPADAMGKRTVGALVDLVAAAVA